MAAATYEVTALSIALLPASYRERAKDFAAYSLEWSPLAASAARAKAQFQVASDVDFVALYATGFVTTTAAPPVDVASPAILINFSVADRQVFDKDVRWQTIIGNAGAPFPLPFPLWMPAATTLVGLATDLSTVASVTRVTFHGFIMHSYPRGQSRAY